MSPFDEATKWLVALTKSVVAATESVVAANAWAISGRCRTRTERAVGGREVL